jgi:antitoxin (DNA-binding transcriptional repressor) of toxin-antitoxin stability system
MRTVGIKVLKDKLSEYVRLAGGGETILITDHDRVVAELVPPGPTRAERVPDALLADAVRHGLVTPAALAPGTRPPRAPAAAPLAGLLAELDADRAER